MIGKQFILAGKAIFTVAVPEAFRQLDTTKPHYTFQVTRKEASLKFPEAYFLALLTGPDNESDYTYVGMIDAHNGAVRLTKGSRLTDDSYPLRLIRRVFLRLWNDEGEQLEANGFHVHHCGYCGRCGRTLTVPESIESGFGPECITKIGGSI